MSFSTLFPFELTDDASKLKKRADRIDEMEQFLRRNIVAWISRDSVKHQPWSGCRVMVFTTKYFSKYLSYFNGIAVEQIQQELTAALAIVIANFCKFGYTVTPEPESPKLWAWYESQHKERMGDNYKPTDPEFQQGIFLTVEPIVPY